MSIDTHNWPHWQLLPQESPDRSTLVAVPTPPLHAPVRTHLANERTFLAWVRTGLTFIAMGLAAAQLLDETHLWGVSLRELLALELVVVGVALTVVGRLRYRQTAIGINTGTYQTHRRGLEVVVAFVVAVAVVAVFVVVTLPK